MSRDSTPNSFVPGEVRLSPDMEALVQRRTRAMGPAYRLSYARPVHFVRGEGVWLYDKQGDAYLDFYNNVASLGHCHPRVVEAMSRQASLLCANTRYLHDDIIHYAERLTELFPPELSQAMFCCTGSEANDLAYRIARRYTGGEGMIVTEYAYHGTSHIAAGMSPNLGAEVPLGRHVKTIPAPQGGEDAALIFERNVRAAIGDFLRHGVKPAGLMVDSLFSSDGIYPDPAGFLKPAVSAIREAGGLFIADEVQPGFARTGDAMWGFQRHGVVPDIATMGKPMGNGYPMAGLTVRPDIVEAFGAGARYFNTFGGNTVAAANGLAVLDVIRDEALQENSRKVGAYFKKALLSVSDERIKDVRGAGLFLGVEIVDGSTGEPDRAGALNIINRLREEKILISATGKNENVLKIRPPLIAGNEHVDRFMRAFDSLLKKN